MGVQYPIKIEYEKEDSLDPGILEEAILYTIGQGPARLCSDEDIARDELGFTNPNLHRRIDPKWPIIYFEDELLSEEYNTVPECDLNDLQQPNIYYCLTSSQASRMYSEGYNVPGRSAFILFVRENPVKENIQQIAVMIDTGIVMFRKYRKINGTYLWSSWVDVSTLLCDCKCIDDNIRGLTASELIDNLELLPRDYMLSISNVHSHRTTRINIHDEESISSEVP